MSDENEITSDQIIGKLFQDMDETVVTWKIPHFTEKLSDPPETSYISTTFAFSDKCWHLKIDPSGDEREETKDYIGLYACTTPVNCEEGCEISYILSIKNSNGIAEYSTNGSSSNFCFGEGYVFFCLKSTLMDRKSELLPNDTLTVECRLKRDDSALVGVSQTERLLNLQNDLKKVLREKESCDVVFKLGNEEIKAHKLILENRCEVFKSMLSHDMVERTTGEITIDDIKPDVFREFLDYMYSGDDDLSPENMRELYVAADKYNLLELKRMCATYMAENLEVADFCDVLALSDKCNDDELSQGCIDFFCKNFRDIIVTEKWQIFNEENKEVTNKLMLLTLKANAEVLKYF